MCIINSHPRHNTHTYTLRRGPLPPSPRPAAQVIKRASCYVKIGELAMAENDYKAVIELPDAPLQHKVFAYNGRGGIRFNRKDYWKAIDDHSEVRHVS